MADLTEDDVLLLDGLLQFYLDLVYLPECENAYRKRQNARARQAIADQAKLGPFDRALFDPDNPPEIVDLLDLDGKRMQFEKYLADDWIRVLLPLFERAGLQWDAQLAKQSGRLAAFRRTIQKWSAEEWNAALPDPAQIKWDPTIADVLPSGVGYIGPQSGYEAAVRSHDVQRALQTLGNIAGGAGGALGYFVYGDEGSDIGAVAEGMLPGGGGRRGGGRAGRARRRNNSRRKAAGSKATASPGTHSRGTGSRGTDAPIAAPRRRKPSQRVKPAPDSPPSKPRRDDAPKRRTPEQRADARAKSAADAAQGKKLTPKIEAKLASARVDVKDAYTREKLNEIFTVNRTDDAPLAHARANSGELRGLIREGKYPGVQKVRFLQPGQSKGDRTPDIEKTMKDGSKEFVEVRTVTGAMRGATVKDAKYVRAPISAQFIDSVESKLRHGQISEKNPGKILFHAPFQPINGTGLEGWREMLGMIRKKGALPKGLRAIEVTGAPDKGTTSMLIFKGPDWQGVLVK